MLRLLAKIALLAVITGATVAKADTDKLDNLAACAPSSIRQWRRGLLSWRRSLIRCSRKLLILMAEVISGGFSQNDLQIADQILGGNLDKVITAYNMKHSIMTSMKRS